MGKRVIVLGADGYIGWPMAMHLSKLGYDVMAIDNGSRRDWDLEGGTESLVPIATPERRVALWKELSSNTITWRNVDLCDYEALHAAVAEWHPEAIVHFAEQRSAPFSMISREHAVRTQVNNIAGNLNLLYAIKAVDPSIHLVKLGTMGEYGTPNIDIEEGYITIEHNGRSDTLPYPKLPHSFYHLSKVADSQNIHFACRVWNFRATDLNQGVVYGSDTPETSLHPDLATRFDYDSIWGTALNRFTIQAASGNDITIYGKGGQTRGYLDLRDTMACITIAIENPAAAGECRIFNQFTEQFNLNELADTVSRAAIEKGKSPRIVHLQNPRIEKEEHYYNAKHTALLDLGLQPHYLSDTLITSVLDVVENHLDRVDPVLLGQPSVTWANGGNDVWNKYSNPDLIAKNSASVNAVINSR